MVPEKCPGIVNFIYPFYVKEALENPEPQIWFCFDSEHMLPRAFACKAFGGGFGPS